MSASAIGALPARSPGLPRKLGVDVLHGHGAKGGAYARLAARKLKRKGSRVKAIYTPHGGSLHYSRIGPWADSTSWPNASCCL